MHDGEEVNIEGYLPERVDREHGDGGGVMILYKNCLQNVLTTVGEERENCEILWMKLDNGRARVKIGVVYMPQEKSTKTPELKKIYRQIEEEVIKTHQAKESIIILGDFNCKVGEKIQGNDSEVSKGGKLLLELCKNTGMVIGNAQKNCTGTWTRRMGNERSILDYVLLWKDEITSLKSMKIDENQEFTPYSEYQNQITYSDHYMIEINLDWIQKSKDEASMGMFKRIDYGEYEKHIEESNIREILDPENFEESYKKWSEEVLKTAKQCSKKTKRKTVWKSNRILTTAKRRIQKKLKKHCQPRERKILMMRKRLILEHIVKEDKKWHHHNVNKVVENIKKEGGFNSTAFAELRRRLTTKKHESGHAIIDENGVRHDEIEEVKNEHVNHYRKLLTGQDETDKTSAVSHVISGMKLLAERTTTKTITSEEISNIVAKLKKRKASDKQGWRNEMIVHGGQEMIKSLVKILQIATQNLHGPTDWNIMRIKSVHKKGSKMLMKNKRGLFITNIISKIVEKVLKERNKDQFAKGLSPNQSGGRRSTIDNIFTILSIIERNNYLNKTTHLTFADVQKCFDSLWLDDGIKDLWLCGVDVRDAIMIRNMNKTAQITVDTPVGTTEEFVVKNIVKQGTVYASDICGASMACINNMGYGIRTMYGPDLQIGALAFVDDVVSAGTTTVSNNTIQACNMMEEKKLITFNTDSGKSAVMKIGKKRYNKSITSQVKRGEFERVNKYKLLGAWVDDKAKYMINIKENQKRIKFMINSTRGFANENNMGELATEGRIHLIETAIIQAILHGSEGFPSYTQEEEAELEKLQGNLIRELMEISPSTPYIPLLWELGLPTMRARINYRKLMLYHNLSNSDDRRIAKRVLEAQKDMDRPGTWFDGLKKLLIEYNLQDTVKDDVKSRWKNKVKKQIKEKTMYELKEKCVKQSKARSIIQNEYQIKEYLKVTPISTAKKILTARLHMVKIPCNYKGQEKDTNCWLCGVSNVKTEHFFTCEATKAQQKVWSVKESDLLSTNTQTQIRVSCFLEKIAEIYRPKWETLNQKPHTDD